MLSRLPLIAGPAPSWLASPVASAHWVVQLRARLAAHWALKAWVIPLWMGGFFAAYFCVLQHPQFPVSLMPLTALDRWIAFHPAAMGPYASLWIYVVLGAGLVRGRREIRAYLLGATTLTIVGLGAFWLWPTATPQPAIGWDAYPSFAFLKRVDAAGNACPSLHVAFAVLNFLWLGRVLRQAGAPSVVRALNAVWCLAIACSTLATKQHVLVDVLAGTALGAVGGLFGSRVRLGASAEPDLPLNRPALSLVVSVTSKLTVVTLGLGNLPPAAAALLFFGPDVWILAGLLVPNASSLIPTATRFITTRREVWLTIDDGPEPATTRPMLDLLDRHGAKATFFVIGAKASAHPELVAEIRRRGHTLGNHTQSHPLAAFWLAGPTRTTREIDACAAVLRRAGAPPTEWFRAPAGIKSLFLDRHLATRGLVLVGWSARGCEVLHTTIDAPLRRLKRHLRPGAILLVHESATRGDDRIALLAALLDHLAHSGYRCVLPERAALR